MIQYEYGNFWVDAADRRYMEEHDYYTLEDIVKAHLEEIEWCSDEESAEYYHSKHPDIVIIVRRVVPQPIEIVKGLSLLT